MSEPYYVVPARLFEPSEAESVRSELFVPSGYSSIISS